MRNNWDPWLCETITTREWDSLMWVNSTMDVDTMVTVNHTYIHWIELKKNDSLA